jgi:hypothetical protein
MKPKDPCKDILVMAMVIVVNFITVSFIYWATEGFIQSHNALDIEIYYFAVVFINLLIYDITYIAKLYIIAKSYKVQWTKNRQMWFKRAKVINVISFVLLLSVMLNETNVRSGNTYHGPYCSLAECDAHSVFAAAASYWAVPGRTDIPSVKTLEDSEQLSLNGHACLFGDVNSKIWVIVSDDTKKCPRGNYYLLSMGRDHNGFWLSELPAGIPNPLPEVLTHKLKWIPKRMYLILLIPFFLYFRWYYVTVHQRKSASFCPHK